MFGNNFKKKIMQKKKTKILLIASILAVIILPLLSAYIHFDGHFPKGYLDYPALQAPDKPGFNIWWFVGIFAGVVFVALLYFFPRWFGFKKVEPDPGNSEIPVKLPWWFWGGLLLAGLFLTVQWGKFSNPKWMVYYGYVPAFWGYIMVIDSIVYVRTNGYSMLSKHIKQLLPIAVSSGIGWSFFGFLNIFVDGNWFYPIGDHISKPAFFIYAFLGAMTLVPCVFVTYHLLDTSKLLHRIYSKGPKVVFSDKLKIFLLILTSAGMFAVTFFPYQLFPVLWIGPAAIFALVLELCRVWTPFTPIAKKGNWTPVALVAVAGLIQGFIWEGTNFFAASHDPFHTEVPGYWIYSVPYVDVWHVFEMPFLGLFGYMPYGIMCWLFWILFAKLINFPDSMWKLDDMR